LLLYNTSHYLQVSLKGLLGFLACLAAQSSHALPFGGEIPAYQGKPALAFQRYEPSWLDLPPGGYLIPNTSFVAFTAAAQDDAAVAGVLGGALGVLALHAASSPGTEEAVKSGGTIEFMLSDELASLAPALLADITAQGQPTSTGEASPISLKIMPQGFMQIPANGLTTVTIQVEAQLLGADGEALWANRYSFIASDARALAGPDGWLENHNARLRKLADDGITTALHALAMDLQNRPNTDATPRGRYRFGKGSLPWVGVINGKAIVKEVVNRRTGTVTHFLDLAQCETAH
jgi:hypothetical protein